MRGRKWIVVISILFTVFAMICIPLSVFFNRSLTYNKDLLQRMINNTEKFPLLEIFKSETNNCPEDTETLLTDLALKVSDFCHCQQKDSGKIRIQQTSISDCSVHEEYGYLCSYQKPSSEKVTSFRGSVLCARRSTVGFDQMERHPNSSLCPLSTKNCGKDHHGYLCIDKDETCPINYLKVVESDTDPFKVFENQHNIDLGNNRYLIYSNSNTEGIIITELTGSFNDICLNDFEFHVDNQISLSLFKNEKTWVNKCSEIQGESIDTRWEKMDELNFLSLIGDNFKGLSNLNKSSFDNLKQKDVSFHIWTRGYIYFNKDCAWELHKSEKENISLAFTYTAKKNMKKKTFSIILIMWFIIFGIIGLISSIISCSDSPKNCNMLVFMFVILILVAISFIFYLVILSWQRINTYEMDELHIGNLCFDSISSKQLIDYTNKRKNGFKFFLALLMFYGPLLGGSGVGGSD